MAWVRIDDQAPWHPKMLRAGESACWLWACGLAYCSAHLTDGEIPGAAITTMGVKRPAEAAAKLVAVGLWEPTDDGFLVHDYLEYNPSSAQVCAKRKAGADRVQNWKLTRGHVGQKRDGNAVTNATETPLLTHEERDGNAVTNAAPVPVPVPVPDPVPQKSGDAPRPDASHLKPLSYRPRVDVAWPGRPPVPGPLHAEFRERLAGDAKDADARLRAWYPTVADAYVDQDIGDDPWKFWNARFREWVGTTVRVVRPSESDQPSNIDRMVENLKKRGVL